MKRKRAEVLSWEDYFINIAFLSAQRSKDPNTQVGCCIVSKDNKIVGIGYNGLPRNCSDDEFPWGKGKQLQNKKWFVCHAEMNAILNANTSVEECTLFSTLFPCNECAKIIIQSKIKNIKYVYEKDNLSSKASKIMFDKSEINYRKINKKNINI